MSEPSTPGRSAGPCPLGAQPRGRSLGLGAGFRYHEVALQDGERGFGYRTSSSSLKCQRRSQECDSSLESRKCNETEEMGGRAR